MVHDKKKLYTIILVLIDTKVPALHDRHFSGRCHAGKLLIERDNSGMSKSMCVKVRTNVG